jgi:hypothetical protein
VVEKLKWFSLIPMNESDGELFNPSGTPSLRATAPVPDCGVQIQEMHLGKSLSRRERVARASGPGEGYRIY